MYEKCLNCSKFGTTCNIAKLFSLSSKDLLSWCRKQKNTLHMSNSKLAELSGIPKGTVDRILAEDSDLVDYKYETIRHIVRALFGSNWTEDPCSTDIDETALLERVKQLEEEI